MNFWEAVNTEAAGGKLTDEAITDALKALVRQQREWTYESPTYVVHPEYLRQRGWLA